MRFSKIVLFVLALNLWSSAWATKVQLNSEESFILNFSVFYMSAGSLLTQFDQASRESLHYGRVANVVCDLPSQSCLGKNSPRPMAILGYENYIKTFPNFVPSKTESAWLISVIEKYTNQPSNEGQIKVKVIDCEEIPIPDPTIRNAHSCVMTF